MPNHLRKIALGLITAWSLDISAALVNPECPVAPLPPAYVKLKKKVDADIALYSNKKIYAEQADLTLSKLIEAKSPLIKIWIEKRNLDKKSEDQIAHDWRDYFTRNFILTKYPYGEPAVDAVTPSLMDSINRKFKTKSTQSLMQGRFQKSQDAAVRYIKTLKISEQARQEMLARVTSVRLYWMDDFKDSKFKSLPLDFLDWGIAYDPQRNEINLGIRSLRYPNEETYLAVFLHELGHAVDSCRFSTFFKTPWPFSEVGECLRSQNGVGAKRRDDSELDSLLRNKKLSTELAAELKTRPTCN
ncbi:MAG: hypothetical protein EOP09_16325, partial [Proteobacteria bacterium]